MAARNERSDDAAGCRGERRPGDAIGNAVKPVRTATGEETEKRSEPGKEMRPQKWPDWGQSARKAPILRQRAEIARRAAAARWKRTRRLTRRHQQLCVFRYPVPDLGEARLVGSTMGS